VLDYWDIYRQNLLSILNFSGGGLGIWGGLIGMFLGFWIVTKIRRVNFLSVLDLIAAPLLLSQAIGRLGNFVNQEAFGQPADLPWAIFIDFQNRPFQYQTNTHFHPTFFYEAILNRFLVEFYRIDTATVGQLKLAQLLSVILFTVGLFLFAKLSKIPQK
jgi:phosphatidylglycerol:prolipoprotein diacylglycerol transferase